MMKSYLVQIKSFRNLRETYFLDETWVDSNVTIDKRWQLSEIFGVLHNYNAGDRLVTLHAGIKMALFQTLMFCINLEVPVASIMGS